MSGDGKPPKVYIDTNIFIDAFEGENAVSQRLEALFVRFAHLPGVASTSELTWAEVLGRDSPRGWDWQTRFYFDLFVGSSIFQLHPVSREVLERTAIYRRSLRQAGRKANLPDAIHVVTALCGDCRYFLSSDMRVIVPEPLERIVPDETGILRLLEELDA